jgi:predicted small lipoprotein YifL
MSWHRWLAALFVILALAACAQGGPVPYAPYPPENVHDRGGDM